jgi:hypothetical protein
MSGSELIIFSDKNRKPDDDIILPIIGDNVKWWKEILVYLGENYKDSAGDWNFYNDGKQWVYKMTCKKKTIFWANLLKESYKITFYFGDKAEPIIEESEIPQSLKDSFINGKRYGKIRAITLPLSCSEDVEAGKKLIEIKMKLK